MYRAMVISITQLLTGEIDVCQQCISKYIEYTNIKILSKKFMCILSLVLNMTEIL